MDTSAENSHSREIYKSEIVQVRFGTVKPSSGDGSDPMPESIRLTSPAGSDIFLAGMQVLVIWIATSRERIRSFDLMLSMNSVVSFPMLIVSGLRTDQTSFLMERT